MMVHNEVVYIEARFPNGYGCVAIDREGTQHFARTRLDDVRLTEPATPYTLKIVELLGDVRRWRDEAASKVWPGQG